MDNVEPPAVPIIPNNEKEPDLPDDTVADPDYSQAKAQLIPRDVNYFPRDDK